jgi:hypothetical protein
MAAERSSESLAVQPLMAAGPARPGLPRTVRLSIACAIVLLAIAIALGGAYAKLWKLPPGVAAMLGLDRASTRSQVTLVVVPARHRAPAMRAEAPPQIAAAVEANAAPSAIEPKTPAPSTAAPAVAPPPPSAAQLQPPSAAAPAVAPPPPLAAQLQPPSAAVPSAKAPPPSAASADAIEPAEAKPDLEPGGGPVLNGDRLLVAVRAKIAADELSAAEAMARRGIARDADDHHAIEALVEVLIEETRGAEAVKYAMQIVRKRPKRASYRLLEGDARMLANDRVGAERAWREALALDPNSRDAKRRLGLP